MADSVVATQGFTIATLGWEFISSPLCTVGLCVCLTTAVGDAMIRNDPKALGATVSPSVPAASAPSPDQFATLAEAWRSGTSSPTTTLKDMVMHWAYQRVIGLGRSVVPLILADLVRQPDHWGWALQSITGENPVPPEAAGDIDAIGAAWIQWGRARGYVS